MQVYQKYSCLILKSNCENCLRKDMIMLPTQWVFTTMTSTKADIGQCGGLSQKAAQRESPFVLGAEVRHFGYEILKVP